MKLFHRFTFAMTLAVLTLPLSASVGAGPVGGTIHFPPAIKMSPFTAPPKPPAVEATIPADGAVNVGVQGPVGARLNRAVPPDTDLQASLILNCRESPQAPWFPVPLSGPAMTDPKTFVFQPQAPLPFNAECGVTLMGPLPKMDNGDSLTTWHFKTRHKDECQLDACRKYYDTMEKWLLNPEAAKCVDKGGEDCLVGYVLFIPKADYQNTVIPLLDECSKSHPDEASSFEAEFIEGTSCNNPNAIPDRLVWTDEEKALAGLNDMFPGRFQKADVQGKVAVWDPSGAYSYRSDDCQNMCRERTFK